MTTATVLPQPPSYKRLAFLGVAALVHIGIIYALATGLAQRVVQIVRGPVNTRIIEEVVQRRDEPPPPPPKIEQLPPYIPPPEVNLTYTPDAPTTAISQVQTKVKVAPPKPAPVVVAAKMDPRHPNARPPYPPMSIRLQEEGSLILALWVKEDGRVGDAKVDQSSGFPRLDEAATREALRSWRFVPAKENGKAIGSWMRIKFTFRLEDQ